MCIYEFLAYSLHSTIWNAFLAITLLNLWGSRSTLVARWTAGQQAERSILHLRHVSRKIHLISPGYPLLSISLQCLIVCDQKYYLYDFPCHTF